MHWIRRHDRGRPPHPDVLTPAEWRVLEHVRQGLTNAEIAARLGVSVNTVRTHVSSMLAKTGLADREALARWQGTPAPASRLALARERSPLLAPLAWLRQHARTAGIGAGVALGAAALVLAAAAMPRVLSGKDTDAAVTPAATPSPFVEVITPTASATAGPRTTRTNEVLPRAPLMHPGAGSLSAALDSNGWPAGAVGPLVVYRRNITRAVIDPGRNQPLKKDFTRSHEYVVFDLGAHDEISTFTVTAGAPPQAHVVGTRLFLNYVGELWVYALDGSGGRRLIGGSDHPRYIESMAVSSDGSLVAVTHYRDESDHEDLLLEVIYVPTGDVTFRSTQTDAAAAGMRGHLSVHRWSTDGQTIAVGGHLHKEDPWHLGTLRLDGVYRFLEEDLPTGEWLDPLDEQPSVHLLGECGGQMMPYWGARTIEFRDPTIGATLNRIESDWPVYEVVERSPDRRELLYRQYDPPPDLRDSLTAGGCDTYEGLEAASQAPFTLHILSADGAPPIEVSSLREAYERWFGDRIVTFACGDEEAVGMPMSRPAFEDPACMDAMQELRIGGQPAGSGHLIEVLGFVDRP